MIRLGCIADDFTGGTDLASTLVGQGMRTVQVIDVPDHETEIDEAEAVVVALKSRTTPPADAIAESLRALEWLKTRGATQFFFKYCSTFDSTDQGNIGPVADALIDALGADFTIACPAFPTNKRTVYKGHLFVGDQLISDSSMKDHPLTPMRDPDLVSVLSRQTKHGVGLVEHGAVGAGSAEILQRYEELRSSGHRYAIVDAIDDRDLIEIGTASSELKLLTGGSGVALGLPENFRQAGVLGEPAQPELPRFGGRRAVIAGSCSTATRGQIALASKDWPAYRIDPRRLTPGHCVVSEVVAWAGDNGADNPVLIYSSADPDEVAGIQEDFGREEAGAMVEDTMGRIAAGLVGNGARELIVAGGETSGDVVQALGISALRIGPEIDPGVPWTEGLGSPRIALALKSGNFGTEDFFPKAFGMLS